MNVRRRKWRGLAVIISWGTNRPGSDSDLRRLESTADYLNFELRAVLDTDAGVLDSTIGDLLKEVKEEDECLLCCVCAHGAVSRNMNDDKKNYERSALSHYIFDNEGRSIQLSAILKGIAVASKLEGKPKVFVVNACRGTMDEIDGTSDLPQEQNDLNGIDDCLLMYSTRLYTKSLRQEEGYEQGSLLIAELAYQISLFHQTTDVQDIFEKVKEIVPGQAKKLAEEESKKI